MDLVLGPVLAARAWAVRDGRLWSTSAPEAWPVRQPMRARCLAAAGLLRRKSHDAPYGPCSCGIWGLAEPDDLPPGDLVRGVVRLWGHVVEGTRGWRAEFAYPHVLVGDPEVVGGLAALYGVGVVGSWPELSEPATRGRARRIWAALRRRRSEPRWDRAH
jgi:hypothetical protein